MASAHRSDDELALLAMSGEVDPHVEGCAACSEGLLAYRSLVQQLRSLPDPPEHLVEAATAFFRRRRSLEALLERLAEDPGFRARAKAKPERTLREAGLDPLPELVAALRDTERQSGDLAKRIAAKHLWF
jgi:hypothetical protein